MSRARRARPAAVTAPFVALTGVTAAMHVISRTTGSGWLVVVVSFLLGILLLSALLPALTLAGVKVRVDAPADATAGRPITLSVRAAGRVRDVMLRLSEPASDWVRVDGPGAGAVRAVPARRGVVRQADVEVRSAAPFGLVWWRRRLPAPLDRPLEVGPAPLDVAAPAPVDGAEDSTGGAARASSLGPELPCGVRDYVAGDPPRLVSWVATARHGRLMVKQLDAPASAPRVSLVVDLRGEENAAEETAARAAGMAVAALRQGFEVVLATAEAGGPRLGPVTSAVQVGRRLARATADGPPAIPASTGVRAGGGRWR